jgi:hypothetical protein
MGGTHRVEGRARSRPLRGGLLALSVCVGASLLLGFRYSIAEAPARMRLSPAHLEFARPGVTHTLDILIEEVEGVYAGDAVIAFDPHVLQVVDSDPGRPGVQITRGEFPAGHAFVNAANNQLGLITYSVFSSQPVSGGGAFAHIVFEGRAGGYSAIDIITRQNGITRTGLYGPGPAAAPIPFVVSAATAHVGGQAFLPLAVKGAPILDSEG